MKYSFLTAESRYALNALQWMCKWPDEYVSCDLMARQLHVNTWNLQRSLRKLARAGILRVKAEVNGGFMLPKEHMLGRTLYHVLTALGYQFDLITKSTRASEVVDELIFDRLLTLTIGDLK